MPSHSAQSAAVGRARVSMCRRPQGGAAMRAGRSSQWRTAHCPKGTGSGRLVVPSLGSSSSKACSSGAHSGRCSSVCARLSTVSINPCRAQRVATACAIDTSHSGVAPSQPRQTLARASKASGARAPGCSWSARKACASPVASQRRWCAGVIGGGQRAKRVAPVPQPAGLALSVLRQRRSADRASCVQQTIVAVGMPHSPKTTSVFERA